MKHAKHAALLMLAAMLTAVSCVKEQKYDPEPSTVSEEDMQYKPAMTLIVTPDQVIKFTLTTRDDKGVTDRQVRDALISKAVDIYNASGHRRIRMTPEDADSIAGVDTIATPFQQMARGEWEPVGLTVDDDLPIWLEAARSVRQDSTLGPVADYFERVAHGAIAIRTDKNIPYVYMEQIFDLMQMYGFSNFALMTDLDD